MEECITLNIAVEKNYPKMVQLLLQHPLIDPSLDHNFVFMVAAQNGFYEVVEILASDPRVDPFDSDLHAYKIAMKNEHTKIVELLEGLYTKKNGIGTDKGQDNKALGNTEQPQQATTRDWKTFGFVGLCVIGALGIGYYLGSSKSN